ncbi:MAG: GTP cyclohydrolase I FolE2 [Bdellovibrionaceae bacterium]|nr:GTP cyclohydrolase I FolE2 [Pseudobdellovibrionaceae bacterium]
MSYPQLLEKENNSNLPILKLIDLIENVLQTPVQAAVKREDEQEFARLNGQNLMFCEDAARRVRECLEKSSFILDYFGKFQHFESLHPHNAVSFIQKDKSGLSGFLLSTTAT